MSRSVQTPSKAFAFPNEWLPVRLGSIGKTYGGLTGKSGEDFNTGSASYVTFMQVMGNSRLREPAKGTVNIKPEERQNHVQKDDLLFNGSSETPEEVALAAAVDFHPDSDTFLNSFCFGFRLLPDAPADSLYLAYLFRSSVGRNLVSSLAQGATRYNISKTQLLNQAIHLPSKAEQIAIREKLTDAEELINSLERLISKKQAIKQGMVQQLFSGHIRLPGFGNPWREARLGHMGKTYGGLTGKSKQDFVNGNARFVTFMQVMTEDRLTESGQGRVTVRPEERQNSVRKGDILFNGSSETPEEVALAAAVETSPAEETYLNSFCFGFRLNSDAEIDPVYLARYFRSAIGRATVSTLAQGATRYNISKTQLLKVWIELPPLEEQQAISSVISDADDEIETLKRRLESARNIKQGMMQELLTGRTRLPVEEVSS